MPKDIIERLNKELNAALNDPGLRANFEKVGAVPFGLGLEESKAFLANEIAKYRDIITKAGMRRSSRHRYLRLAASSTPAPAIRMPPDTRSAISCARPETAALSRAAHSTQISVADDGDDPERRGEQPELRLPAFAVGQELRQERRLEDQRLRIGERDRKPARERALASTAAAAGRRLARLPQRLDAEEQQIGRADEADQVEILARTVRRSRTARRRPRRAGPSRRY